MAPKKASQSRRKRAGAELPASAEPQGMFAGMVVFLVEKGVQPRRLQIWKQKLLQMGAIVEDSLSRVTHIFAMDSNAVLQELSHKWLKQFKGNVLQFQWLENSLKSGEKMAEYSHVLDLDSERVESELNDRDPANGELSNSEESTASEDPKAAGTVSLDDFLMTSRSRCCQSGENQKHPDRCSTKLEFPAEKESANPLCTLYSSDAAHPSTYVPDALIEEPSLLYNPPDCNRNIVDIFGELINIYRALGDERRSFSYYKAIPVIEKLPFKIEGVDQVKHLPNIGKSMQDHKLGNHEVEPMVQKKLKDIKTSTAVENAKMGTAVAIFR